MQCNRRVTPALVCGHEDEVISLSHIRADSEAQVVLDDRHVVDSVATPQVRGNLQQDDVGETHDGMLAKLVSEAKRDVGFRRAAPLLGGRVRGGFSAALSALRLRHRCPSATFCEAVSSSARATTFALSGGGLESDAPESGWQKLRENEGEIGYFLVKFGVELWGEILTSRNGRAQFVHSVRPLFVLQQQPQGQDPGRGIR